MKLTKKIFTLLSCLILGIFILTGCSPEAEELAADMLTGVIEAEIEETSPEDSVDQPTPDKNLIDIESELKESLLAEDGIYTSKDEVAAYLHEYGHLPSNFITKKEAKKLGWISSEGNLDEVAPGMSIGGDYFGNYEGNLPEADDRDYYECDIDFDGTYRNAKRIVYSNDGLIYYTDDHYETFELLYGEE